MEHSQTTDTHLGVGVQYWGCEKFRDTRAKAHEEEIERRRKYKKDKTVKVPPYSIGQRVVLFAGNSTRREYLLVECVDFYEKALWGGVFTFFGIVIKTTDRAWLSRVGRLCTFRNGTAYSQLSAIDVPEDSIKWV